MVSPWLVALIAGMFGTSGSVITWIATRHRYQIKAYRELIEDLHRQYGDIIDDMRAEIDRLRAWVLDLEQTVRDLRYRKPVRSPKVSPDGVL